MVLRHAAVALCTRGERVRGEADRAADEETDADLAGTAKDSLHGIAALRYAPK